MVTFLTRALLLVQVMIAAGVYYAAMQEIENISLALLLGVIAVVALRLLITANNFFLAWRYRSPTPENFRIGLRQACRLFIGEFNATLISSSWTMPFHAFTKRAATHPRGLPVLLVHGYGCNSGYWHGMSKALLHAGISHHAVVMEPVFGGIDEYIPLIHQAVEQLVRETGQPKIIIVAHSMGGLATRAYLRVHGRDRIVRVITLGTPHHGTGLANFGVGLNTRQMHWTVSGEEGLASEWLRELAAGEDASTYRLFVNIYSHHDNIVSPQTSSRLPGAKNIEFRAIGHVALAMNPEIQAQVIGEILDAASQPVEPSSAKASRIS